jgi:hypothetical protein
MRAVHGNQEFPTFANLMRHPAGETVPHVDALVAQQPIHLFDRALGLQPPRLRKRLTDQGHRQRPGGHRAQRGSGQRINAVGMQPRPVELTDE